jgi:ABC-type branched-subunit amino acid transport system substrate-binding protein
MKLFSHYTWQKKDDRGVNPKEKEVVMKRLVIVASVLIFSLTFITGALAQEIKVGTLMAHTGPLKEYGPNIKNGAVLAAKQMAAAGFRIRLIHEDSETSAIPATNAAKKLVEIDRVVAIIGALASGVTVPVAESVTCPNNVIMISPASTSPLITFLPSDRGKDFLFRTCPSDALQGVIAGKLAASYNKTASVLYVNNPYGQGLAEQFKRSFERRRGKVLAMVPHDEKAAESYTAELRKALAQKPDRLCAFSYPEHAKVYLKEAIEFFKYKRFLFCDGTKSEDIVKALGARNVEGQRGTAPGTAGGEPFVIFSADYKAEFGRLPPLPFITNAYDGMAVIGLAAYRAKLKGLRLTSTNIRNHMRAVANSPGTIIKPGEFKKAFQLLKQGKEINYEGAAGSVDFDKNGDVVTPIEVWKYSRGTIKTVSMEYDIPKE